jgi:ketol-acid reductoisomerase
MKGSPVKVYYDADADLNLITGKKIAILGYGSQGHAHAQNLRDSGVKEVAIALRPGSASAAKAEAAGFKVLPNAEAAAWADILMILAPDEHQAAIYAADLHANLKPGAAGLRPWPERPLRPDRARKDIDVIMVAPKGPGHTVRGEYVKGGGVPCLIAIHQNVTGNAHDVVWPMPRRGRRSLGHHRDQLPRGMRNRPVRRAGRAVRRRHRAGAGWFRDAGGSRLRPEMAYFECLHELKLIVDLMYEGGIANMRYSISNTAEYGDIKTGPRIITDETKKEMKRVLADIQSGRFVKDFVLDNRAGQPELKASRIAAKRHPIEETGSKLRAMMPWIGANKLVDQTKN